MPNENANDNAEPMKPTPTESERPVTPPLNDPKYKAAVAASIAAAAVVAVVAVKAFDADEHTRKANDAIGDAGLSRSSGDLRMTELLGGEAGPGEVTGTSVHFDLGWRVTELKLDGKWELINETHHDDARATTYAVLARNTGTERARLTGLIKYAAPAVDAGVDSVP